MRKIIQITSTSYAPNPYPPDEYVIHAVCDDGTLWEMGTQFPWQQLPTPPAIDAASDREVG